jgi:small subunit ribosomal protein S3
MGITKTWQSTWFSSGKTYIKNAEQDIKIRKFLLKKLRESGVDKVEIERNAHKITIKIYSAKPGVLIGRGGTGIEDLKKQIHTNFLKSFRLNEIDLNIMEVDRPNLSAQINVQSMIMDIEKRVPFKKVMKSAMGKIEKAGALGAKIIVGGRLNGAEIARSEKLVSGKIPLQTLRADIDYARGAAHTTYGAIGIKVWIYKGEVFKQEKEEKGQVVGKNKQ